MLWKNLTMAAAVLIGCAAALSPPYDESDLKARRERIERAWPGSVERAVKLTAEHCAGSGVPTKVLMPELLYRGHINDVAVSSTGAIAVADISKDVVLIFDSAASREPSLQIPVGRGYGGGLGFSASGRFLVWSSVFDTQIYDVRSRQPALIVGRFQSHGMQWVGEDLLLMGYDDYNMNVETTSLLRLKDGAFEREVLDTMVFGKGHIPTGASEPLPNEDNFALADQLGRSLVSSDKGVYQSFEAAIRDGADIFTHKDSIYSERVYRIGDRLVQPDNHDNLFQKPEVPWSLLLRDGTTGKVLKSLPLAMPWCVPWELSVARDGSRIAMLTGPSVLMLDPADLSTRAVYGLDAPAFVNVQSIDLSVDNTLIVWSTGLDPDQQSVFVYTLP